MPRPIPKIAPDNGGWFAGATSHETAPPAAACASHVPPSQSELADAYPVTCMLKRALRSLTHASASVALMKLPSQKIAVCAMHPPVHFSMSEAVQFTLPMAWQLMS